MIEADRPSDSRRHFGEDAARQVEPSLDEAPLILTLLIDGKTQGRLDRLREVYFPPERNLLSAHVTLFHHLPGAAATDIAAHLSTVAADTAPFPVEATRLFSLGRGVAVGLESAVLQATRRRVAERWADRLTAQDRQTFRPHVTIQNKVSPDVARATLRELAIGFAPSTLQAEGLALWRYRGGPWEPAGRWLFTAPPADRPARHHR